MHMQGLCNPMRQTSQCNTHTHVHHSCCTETATVLPTNQATS